MGKNATPEESKRSKEEMSRLFNLAIKDAARFKLVYAFDTDVSTTSFVIRKTTYTYMSYILGYDAAAKEIILIETDPSLEQYGEVLRFPSVDIIKATYSSYSSEYNLRIPKLKKGYIQFCVPVLTDDEELYPPILQEQESADFNKFFTTQLATNGSDNGTMDALGNVVGEAMGAVDDAIGNVKGKLKGLFGKK